MTEQEQQLISGLAERIRNAPQQPIDRDADDLIRRTIGSRPDALYILTQTVLIQEVALKQANAQLDQLSRAASATGELPSPATAAALLPGAPVTPRLLRHPGVAASLVEEASEAFCATRQQRRLE